MSEDVRARFEQHWLVTRGGKKAVRELKRSERVDGEYEFASTQRHWWTWQAAQPAPSPPLNRASECAHAWTSECSPDWRSKCTRCGIAAQGSCQ